MENFLRKKISKNREIILRWVINGSVFEIKIWDNSFGGETRNIDIAEWENIKKIIDFFLIESLDFSVKEKLNE